MTWRNIFVCSLVAALTLTSTAVGQQVDGLHALKAADSLQQEQPHFRIDVIAETTWSDLNVAEFTGAAGLSTFYIELVVEKAETSLPLSAFENDIFPESAAIDFGDRPSDWNAAESSGAVSAPFNTEPVESETSLAFFAFDSDLFLEVTNIRFGDNPVAKGHKGYSWRGTFEEQDVVGTFLFLSGGPENKTLSMRWKWTTTGPGGGLFLVVVSADTGTMIDIFTPVSDDPVDPKEIYWVWYCGCNDLNTLCPTASCTVITVCPNPPSENCLWVAVYSWIPWIYAL